MINKLITSIFQNNNIIFLNSKKTPSGWEFKGIYKGNNWWNERGRLLTTIERIIGRGNCKIKEYGSNITIICFDKNIKETKKMKLTMSQLRRIIKETAYRVIKETTFEEFEEMAKGAGHGMAITDRYSHNYDTNIDVYALSLSMATGKPESFYLRTPFAKLSAEEKDIVVDLVNSGLKSSSKSVKPRGNKAQVRTSAISENRRILRKVLRESRASDAYAIGDEALAQPGMVNSVMEAIREYFMGIDTDRFNVWQDGNGGFMSAGDYLEEGWQSEVVCPKLDSFLNKKEENLLANDPDGWYGDEIDEAKIYVIDEVMELMHKSGEMEKGSDYGSDGWLWAHRPADNVYRPNNKR